MGGKVVLSISVLAAAPSCNPMRNGVGNGGGVVSVLLASFKPWKKNVNKLGNRGKRCLIPKVIQKVKMMGNVIELLDCISPADVNETTTQSVNNKTGNGWRILLFEKWTKVKDAEKI